MKQTKQSSTTVQVDKLTFQLLESLIPELYRYDRSVSQVDSSASLVLTTGFNVTDLVNAAFNEWCASTLVSAYLPVAEFQTSATYLELTSESWNQFKSLRVNDNTASCITAMMESIRSGDIKSDVIGLYGEDTLPNDYILGVVLTWIATTRNCFFKSLGERRFSKSLRWKGVKRVASWIQTSVRFLTSENCAFSTQYNWLLCQDAVGEEEYDPSVPDGVNPSDYDDYER